MRPVRRIIAAQVEKKSLLLFNCVNYTIPSSTSGYRLIEARTPCVPRDQGQAAGPAGEGRPPKVKGPAWTPQPGPWENIPRTVTNRGALSIHRLTVWAAGFAYCGRFL